MRILGKEKKIEKDPTSLIIENPKGKKTGENQPRMTPGKTKNKKNTIRLGENQGRGRGGRK